ncbi:hypothetical protein BG95_07200 [Thermosipho sp. 1063]|uniref:hypothetical protein n=1 Tax=unclassified Thermosipho (in: thermotogales) TaxID=2676525 RepID=UPI000949423E|nr:MULTISPECIES: hypothetical protein [unclassified Thermosipho (in: thermotogales)]ANQ54202.1 hypothetical protein Y592_07285 [Thermosipho sp. 1070]APT72647.1 hypothetical protein BG95_07200 [Thermosipho sp. 1063]OOC42043.1 hypothetical protein XO08_07045 [Thermosipho sp. 1074]
MKFIDSFVFKYVKKEKKNDFSKILNEISKFSEQGINFSVELNENIGRLRLELYETNQEKDLIFFKGLLYTNIDKVDFSNLMGFSEKIVLPSGLVLDYAISEGAKSAIKGLFLDGDVAYVVVDSKKTEKLTNKALAILVLEYLVNNVFEVKFNQDDYEIEIETELTDYFI